MSISDYDYYEFEYTNHSIAMKKYVAMEVRSGVPRYSFYYCWVKELK